MCGIAVAVDWDEAEASARRLVDGISHRGDVTDPVITPRRGIAMATRRLRIVDGTNAIQPMASFDGRLLVSFNGEIYNHAILRAELETLGVSFKTESDTEVLANALRMWGPNALLRLNGMFAFVAIDISTGEFLAARDPFGVKPLYVVRSSNGFLFCSEIQPLLNATDEGEVLLLPPGFLLTRSLCVRYSVRPSGSDNFPIQFSPKKLDRMLSEAVRIRMPKDLPIVVMFSGGIDSTLVAHYARQFQPETPGYMLAGPDCPDYAYARRYADQTNFDLRILPFDPFSDQTFSLLDTIVEVVESFEPTVVRGSLCSYLIAQKIHQDGFRIAMCGEGADELFCGYPALADAFSLGNKEGFAVREQTLCYMHRAGLQRVDRCSMRFGIETREPFLDPSIVAHALRLDGAALVGTMGAEVQGKMALRGLYDLCPEKLPAFIRDRKKVGFDEGAGLDTGTLTSRWVERFEDVITDREFAGGKHEFEAFELTSKEELFYIRKLAARLDLARIPHLRGRLKLAVPETRLAA